MQEKHDWSSGLVWYFARTNVLLFIKCASVNIVVITTWVVTLINNNQPTKFNQPTKLVEILLKKYHAVLLSYLGMVPLIISQGN